MPEKPDLEMTAGMAYDPSGADEAKADLKDTAAASEQAAQKSAAASDKDAEKQKQLAQMMRLTMMTRRELREEILRLIAAQKSAAAANDTKRYEQLTTSINRAKEALEKLNTAQQVGMIAMQQQAQTGMQFAQGLGSMKEAASQGAAGLATMATQAIALGMAIKAGLGPIGWVMAALQGLGMIVTHFTEKSKKEEEGIKAATKALEEQTAALDKNAAAHEKNAAAQALADADDKAEGLKKAAKKKLDEMREENRGKEELRRQDLDQKRRAAEMARKEDAAEVQAGRMDPAEASARDKMRQEKVAAAEKDAEAAAAAEEQTLLGKEKETGAAILKARQETLKGLTKGLSGEDMAVLAIEDKALQQLVNRFDEAAAREKQQEEKVEELRKKHDDDPTEANLQAYQEAEENLEELWQERLNLERELVERTRKQVEVLEKKGKLDAKTKEGKAAEAVSIISGINAAQEAVEKQEESNRQLEEKSSELLRQQETLKRESELHDAAAKAAEKEASTAQHSAALAEGWKEAQTQAAPKRIAWLQEMLAGLEEESALHRQYNELLKQELAAQETAARQEEWQRVQREGSLADQAAWLRDTAGHLEAGSEEAKKWAEQLQGVETRQIQEAMGNLEKEFKVTGNYVAEDKRTQRQILQDDKKALAGRAQRLQALIAETKDFSLRQQLQEKLDETVKQQKALEAATAANAKACRAMLKGYKAPEFHDKNKMVERNLKQLGHAYARNIKLAEKAAEKGDTKAQERYTRLAGKYADRIARKRKDFTKEHEKNLDAIQAAQKKQKNEEEGSAKDSKKSRSRKNREDAKQKPKKDAPKQNAPKKKAAPAQQQKKEHELADTKAALADAQKALGDMSGKVAELAGVTAQIASAASEIAKTAGAKLKSLKKQLKTMQTDISNLWKEIDA
ncbi:MAG: hypothetical protein Q4E43_05275 [Akkermansia sp.]|nr:hypothetical protein [Akkermansia sp.]